MENEKRYISHTNPDWNLELPDGDLNSLVSKDGRNHDDGYNFDERDDDENNEIETSPEAERAKNEARGEEAIKNYDLDK